MKTLALCALLLVVGCAETQPVDTTVNVLSLKRKEGQKIETPNVGVAAEVVTPANANSYKGVTIVASWREADPNQVVVQLASEAKTRERKAPVRILPLPVFIVRIDNKSKAPVSLANSDISLDDGKGHVWRPYGDPSEMMGRVKTDIIGQYPGTEGNQGFFDNIQSILGKLPYVSQKTTVAPGEEFQGFLPIKLDAHDLSELDAYLHGVDELTLRIKNIQGEKPFDLAIAFDKTQVPLVMSCPPGQSDLKKCKQKE